MKHFLRRTGNRPYKTLFILSTEGFVTEPEYFRQLETLLDGDAVHVEIVCDSHKSAPVHVLKRAKDAVRTFVLSDKDEVWCVIDKDKWPREQIQPLHVWSQEPGAKEHRGLAVSMPKFELWLLLHVEEVVGQHSSAQVSERIRPYLNAEKHIPMGFVTHDRVNAAIARAEALVPDYYEPWPNKTGTTVFLLVKQLLEKQPQQADAHFHNPIYPLNPDRP